jgi:DNA polymerase-3 subunit beta
LNNDGERKNKQMPTTTAPVTGLKVSTPRKDLFEGVQIVSKAVATRTSLPILGHVLISQDEKTGQVRLTATDLELWIEHTLPRAQEALAAIVGGGGATTAPARNLADLLAALPEASVELTAEGGESTTFTTHVRCNRANFKLLALNADEFPVLPEVSANNRLVIAKSELREAVKQVLFAVSTDESRVILTGVLLTYKEGVLRVVATDTHRLAVREIKVIEGARADLQAVIPARALSELLRVVGGNDEGSVSLVLSDNQIQFRVEDEKTGSGTTIISRLIEGQFPNYERVVPTGYDRKITLERELFVAALKRAAIFAREQGSANRVVIRSSEDIDGDRLIITAISDTLGTALEEVEITREGATDPVEIAFNVKYLIDVLNAIESDGVHLELTAPLRPGVVRPTEGSDYFCVLMPMQVV